VTYFSLPKVWEGEVCGRTTWGVIAGLVPATPLNEARPCHVIGVAGTSPAMTAVNEDAADKSS
jgi:hypothetical protein